MNASSDADIALLEIRDVWISSIREHDLCLCILHDLLEIAAVLANHYIVVMRRYFHGHLYWDLSLKLIMIMFT